MIHNHDIIHKRIGLAAPVAKKSSAGDHRHTCLLCFEKEALSYQEFVGEAATGFISNSDIIQ